MCSCTHEDPYRCSARLGRHACTCSCHRLYRAETVVQQGPGPRNPLEEKDAEIEQLWVRIARLEVVAEAARTYLVNSTPINAVALDKALRQAKGEQQG